MNLPAVRLSQHFVETTANHAERIRAHVRVQSAVLVTACRQRGLPIELAELCAGILASVVDDLVNASQLPRKDFERAKRMERVLQATEEPQVNALRIAIAASPANGRACARHWDAICEKSERGMFAWRLGMDTDAAYKYSRKLEKAAKRA